MNIIPPVGDRPSSPANSRGNIKTLDKLAAVGPAVKKDVVPDTAIPIEHLPLLRLVRDAIHSAKGITKLLRQHERKLPVRLVQALGTLGFDPKFKAELEILEEAVSKSGADLSSVLITKLRSMQDLKAKAVIADALISLDRKAFIKDYLVPSLEERAGFYEDDCKFCVLFLSSLTDADLELVLSNIDYSDIGNFNCFASSLAALPHQESFLQTLLDASEMKVTTGDQAEDSLEQGAIRVYTEDADDEQTKRAQEHQRLIMEELIIAVSQKLKRVQRPLPVEALKKLYIKSNNNNVYNQAALLLKEQLGIQAAEFFKGIFLDEMDSSNDWRLKRFHAIISYVSVLEDKAANQLKKFILKSNDPFLVGIATIKLASDCGSVGQELLASAIYQKVSDGEVSFPLAYVSSMVEHGGQYIDVLQKVFSKPFPHEKGLKEAYSASSDIDLCRFFRTESGRSILFLDCEKKPNLIVDLIYQLGLRVFSEWAFPIQNDSVNEIVLSNIKDVFATALEVDRDKMSSIVLGGITSNRTKPDETARLILHMGGMGNYGTKDRTKY